MYCIQENGRRGTQFLFPNSLRVSVSMLSVTTTFCGANVLCWESILSSNQALDKSRFNEFLKIRKGNHYPVMPSASIFACCQNFLYCCECFVLGKQPVVESSQVNPGVSLNSRLLSTGISMLLIHSQFTLVIEDCAIRSELGRHRLLAHLCFCEVIIRENG